MRLLNSGKPPLASPFLPTRNGNEATVKRPRPKQRESCDTLAMSRWSRGTSRE